MKKLIAKGKNIHGKKIEFDCSSGVIYCPHNQLTELTIPEGVTHVYCGWNQLTELIIPEGVETVNCWGNKLIELTIPMGVERVYCKGNQLTHLDLPESVACLRADKEVTGLERYVGKVKMKLE